jgi:hypothetical protein
MKSILYLGAVLMTGACIYGFVDYKKASNSKEFKSLYHSRTASTKAALSPQEESGIKTIQKVNEKSMAVPAGKLVAGDELEPAKEFKEVKSADSKRKASKRKKLNYKLYSRAALEEYIPPVVEEKTEKAEKK